MTLLRRTVFAFLLLKLGNLVVNLVRFPVLRRREPPPCSESVSLLIPMRNEAGRIGATLPGMLGQQQVTEVVLLDDGCTDGSAELVTALIADHPHARLVPGSPAPPGWVGKNWVCEQLAAAAKGSMLIFCDADVMLADGAVPAVLGELADQHADLFSVFPRQRTRTLGERASISWIDDILLCFLPFPLLRLDVPAAATANGSLLVFSRVAYSYLGGFAAVHDQLVEDVALARLARRSGCTLGLALGGELVSTRMYTGYREVVRGLGRGLLAVTGGRRSVLLAAAGWHLIVYSLPVRLAHRHRDWRLILLLGVLERLLVQLKTDPRTAWQAVLAPLGPLAFVPIAVQAVRREQTWKDRVYS